MSRALVLTMRVSGACRSRVLRRLANLARKNRLSNARDSHFGEPVTQPFAQLFARFRLFCRFKLVVHVSGERALKLSQRGPLR